MSFLQEFQNRGFFHQCSNLEALKSLEQTQQIVAYIGFDCTANSLHVGSLMQIMILRMLQKHGHRPIAIIGGGTTKIGDPSGKDEARKLLTTEDIEKNKQGIQDVLSKFITFDNKDTGAILIDNSLWLDNLNYIDFLREYGKHFSINKMLGFDSVKLRLEREQSLSFLEFNYMIFQAYDFVELNTRYKCRLQIGGSDQWGNIINGVELSRRLGRDELYGLTTPLITTSTGAKMGKTATGAIWLSADKLPVYDYYQFWRNSEDADVVRFMKLFTDLDLELISQLTSEHASNINNLKKILAFEATKLCHGQIAAQEAEETAIRLFEKGEVGGLIPETNITLEELSNGIAAFKLFVIARLCNSGGEAKRLIQGNGAKINNNLVLDENQIVTYSDFIDNQMILSSGKKKYSKLCIKY
jgi:tyrosyl-tRNA synthetase